MDLAAVCDRRIQWKTILCIRRLGAMQLSIGVDEAVTHPSLTLTVLPNISLSRMCPESSLEPPITVIGHDISS